MLIRSISVLCGVLAAAIFGFLALWYFEVVLWLVLGPFAVASLYLAWILWPRAAKRTNR
jgi:hypothetical protein